MEFDGTLHSPLCGKLLFLNGIQWTAMKSPLCGKLTIVRWKSMERSNHLCEVNFGTSSIAMHLYRKGCLFRAIRIPLDNMRQFRKLCTHLNVSFSKRLLPSFFSLTQAGILLKRSKYNNDVGHDDSEMQTYVFIYTYRSLPQTIKTKLNLNLSSP